ncbi:MAG: response regulator [Cyanothece sp. SIO1E1]|nr:response regulator [Cyanothece sp. SIO1E1]
MVVKEPNYKNSRQPQPIPLRFVLKVPLALQIAVLVGIAGYITQMNANLDNSLKLCLVNWIMTISLGLATSRLLARPTLQLSAAGQQVARDEFIQGDHSEYPQAAGLIASFNQMSTEIQHSYRQHRDHPRILEPKVQARIRASERDQVKVESQQARAIPVAQTTNLQHPPKAQKIISLAANQPRYRILVVEDDRMSRLLMTKLLLPLGFKVREAVNGEEAVSLWESWQPDLIWMDMQMPVMDGYEATRRIRQKDLQDMLPEAQNSTKYPAVSYLDVYKTAKSQNLSTKQHKGRSKSQNRVVIIALSATAFEEDQALMLASGCDDSVSKPFKRDLILNKMAQHLGLRYAYAEPSA